MYRLLSSRLGTAMAGAGAGGRGGGFDHRFHDLGQVWRGLYHLFGDCLGILDRDRG
jgi:hypothetical protein